MDHYIKTLFGNIKITIINDYIVSLDFIKNIPKNYNNNKQSIKLNNILSNYIEHKINPKHPLHFVGTPFQIDVWNQILKIPIGKTKTYTDIANLIGKPNAVRAVANACGQNNIPIFIPCHRVVGKNNIGGYKYDINIKKKLLRLEGNYL